MLAIHACLKTNILQTLVSEIPIFFLSLFCTLMHWAGLVALVSWDEPLHLVKSSKIMIELLQEAYRYALAHQSELGGALLQHLRLIAVALGISILICVPLGIWTARSRVAATSLINLFNGLRVIPSLAILFLAIPYFGLSFTSAALALTLPALPPVLINTDAAYRTIDQSIREAARGMGMTANQLLWRVETPLALPVIAGQLCFGRPAHRER